MQIFRTRLYKTQLLKVLTYISKDKVSASEKFYIDLDKQINNLVNSPLKCRQSFYSDDDNVRDIIFMKYKITILKIFNKNKPKEEKYGKI